VRPPIRALAVSVAAAMAGLAGCTAASQSVTATGKTLRIYLSAPASLGGDPQAQDVVEAERLAFAQLSPTVSSSFKLELRTVTAAKVSNSARSAIEDASAIAYLGEIVPGASADSVGITNHEDLLQVSPTDTALELTQPSAAVAGSPNRYYESLKDFGRTFARVVPTTTREARAQLREMTAVSVKKVYVTDDGSEYGRALALAFRQAAGRSVTVLSSAASADAVLYAGRSVAGAAALFNRVGRADAKVKLFAASALYLPAFASALTPAVRSVYVSTPGFLPAKLSAAARQSFAAPFAAAYHHAPSPSAIFGYEAMAAVLAVLHEDGSLANNRRKVVHDFLAIRDRSSVLGSYSVDANGDTSIAPFVFSRVRAGRLTPFAFQTAG